MAYTFHLLGNAHLDPVWSWDWREGLNEGIATCRAILDLMDEDPDLTFIRGESAVYEHVERHDPAAFARIRAYVEAGRWDPVGGMVVQPDTNLASTETLLHSFVHGQSYYRSRFGRPARAAWLADSFGHSGGLPEIMAAAGIESFAFTRGGTAAAAIAKPAFWWEGTGGSRILAWHPPAGWYGCERDGMPAVLDQLLAAAGTSDLQTVGVLYGLGNHGGGPSRRHLRDIRAWAAAHPSVTVRFSTLHGFMDALRREAAARGEGFFPTFRGELNYCLRGCYASLARFKYAFRRTEALVNRAERTATVIGEAYGRLPGSAGIQNARAGLAFNAFHDVLPGTMIERAADDQLAWLGGAFHRAQRVENEALLALAEKIDTTVRPAGEDLPAPVPILVWNPHPFVYEGPVEIEAALDYRPIWLYRGRGEELPVELRDHAGRTLPFQVTQTEHLAMPDFPWRKRLVTRISVPATGWRLLTVGWKEGASVPAVQEPVTAPHAGCIDNGIYRVTARTGGRGIQVFRDGGRVLGTGGLGVVTVSDPWGSWGGMAEEPGSLDLSTVTAEWRVTGVQTLERGPERAMLWVRMEGGKSSMDLRVSVARRRPAVDVEARVLWNERSARMKLVMPCGARSADFEVPGGVVTRVPCGEVPGGRWVRASCADGNHLGFASDALYGFDMKKGALRATVVRASRYSCDRVVTPDAEPWTPAADAGELRFRFLLAAGDAGLPRMARELEEPTLAVAVPPGGGTLPRSGGLLELRPASLRIVALRTALEGGGVILSVQSVDNRESSASITWMGQPVALGTVPAGKIASWRLASSDGHCSASPSSALA